MWNIVPIVMNCYFLLFSRVVNVPVIFPTSGIFPSLVSEISKAALGQSSLHVQCMTQGLGLNCKLGVKEGLGF